MVLRFIIKISANVSLLCSRVTCIKKILWSKNTVIGGDSRCCQNPRFIFFYRLQTAADLLNVILLYLNQ